MKVNIISPFFGTSGYANHGRSLANALNNAGHNVKVEAPPFPGWEQDVTDTELAMLQKNWHHDGFTIAIMTPPFYSFCKHEHKSQKLVGFLVWEGDKVPRSWEKHLNLCDAVFVPSQHTKDSLHNVNVKPPVFVIPHGVDLSVFKPKHETTQHEKEPFTFVVNKGWAKGLHDRGGVQYVLRAFCEEFKKQEKVRLLIKINPAYLYPGWNLDNEIHNLGLDPDHAEICINAENTTLPQIVSSIYHKGDVYVCAQRADGFNLTGLEALSCGLATIQTSYGGQTDYMTPENSWFVGGELEEVNKTVDLMYEGVRWLNPSIPELRKAMREAFTHQEETRKKGKKAALDSQRWTWTNTVKKIEEAFATLTN